MFYVLLFFSLLLILFFLSRQVTRGMSYLFYRLTKSQKGMVYLMAVFFFPGTLIHEVSHAFAAIILFVPVHAMEFFPKVLGNGVKLGSVQIAHTDPIRRALIGMAPFFFGTSIILTIIYAFLSLGGLENIWITFLTGYVLFEISNTMFSSRKDMEGTLELFIAVLILAIILYVAGVRFPSINPDSIFTEDVVRIFQTGSIFLGVPLVIDLFLLLILRVLRAVHN